MARIMQKALIKNYHVQTFQPSPAPGLRRRSLLPWKVCMPQLTILLVIDDDPSIRSLISSLLESEGYSVATAGDGEEGLQMLQQVKPSLVLLDLQMPRLNGWQFLRMVEEQDISLPVIAMSAAVTPQQLSQVKGVTDFIAKPFDLDVLLAKIAACISA